MSALSFGFQLRLSALARNGAELLSRVCLLDYASPELMHPVPPHGRDFDNRKPGE